MVDDPSNFYCRANVDSKLIVLPMTPRAYSLQDKRG